MCKNHLIETTIKELLDNTNMKKNKFDPKKIKYIGFSYKRKILYFQTGKYYQKINLPDWNLISRLKGEDEVKLKLALKGDIKLYCNCGDWLYSGKKYLAWVLKHGTDKETRKPVIKNPSENTDDLVCKHLLHLLLNINKFIPRILRDVEKSRKRGYVTIVSDPNIQSKMKLKI